MSNESKALELAAEVDEVAKTYPDMAEVSAELRRQHAEIESLQRFKAAYEAWSTKTEWFAREAQPQHLGKHIADAMRDEIASLRAQLAARAPDASKVLHWFYAALAGDISRKEMEQKVAALLSAAPSQQAPNDAAQSVDETNAVLASRYFDLLKVVEAYEKHGVTCQTFRHFVDVPCAECNCTSQQAPVAQGDPVAWERVVNAAREAMDDSFEADNEAMDISIPSHLAAALSLALDEFDAVPVAGYGTQTDDVLRSVWNAMQNSADGDELLARLEHMRGSIGRTIESAATAPLLERIAGLEANEKVLLAQVQGHTQWRERIIKASEQAYGESAIRYKFSLTKSGKCMNTFPREIDGRWFALVPAENDGHIGHIARIAELEASANTCGAGAGCCYQAARIEELERELEAVRKDAERYQKLRSWAGDSKKGAMQGFAHVLIPGSFGIEPAKNGDALDAAIDAAKEQY